MADTVTTAPGGNGGNAADGIASAVLDAAAAGDSTQGHGNVVNHFHFNISLNANADVSGQEIISNVLSAFMPRGQDGASGASVNEASTSGTASTSRIQRPSLIPDTSDSDDGARGGHVGDNRSAALRFASQRRSVPDSDSSTDDDMFVPPPSQATATQGSGRSSVGLVQPRPGLCAKCQNAPPTHAPLCMHLYCEPCIRKMSAKKRPCKVCGKAFRSVKNLYT